MEPIFIYYNNLKFDQNKNFTLEFCNGDKLDGLIFKKNKDYYIKNMSCYVDLAVDVNKLPQFDKIKEIYDLSNAILVGDDNFGYKEQALQLSFDGRTYYFKYNKINRSNYIENIEFFDYSLKKRRIVNIYSPYKELESDNGIKFERTNDSNLFIKYTIKLVDNSTYLTKKLNFSNNFMEDLAKVYDRKINFFTIWYSMINS